MYKIVRPLRFLFCHNKQMNELTMFSQSALKVSAILLVLLLWPVVSASAQDSKRLQAAVDSAVTAYMSQYHVPGLSISVVQESQLLIEQGYGFADLENFVPAIGKTRYPIASISKSVTAVAALQLADRGKLDLDAPIQNYVPGFLEKEEPITSRHLLRHTSGIRHYRDGEYVNTRRYETITESLEAFAQDTLLHVPGAAPTYTSYGYTLLGAVIEQASSMTFLEYLEQHVFAPADMVATGYNDVRQIIPYRSEGYEVRRTGEVVNAQFVDPSNRIPGGGLMSTAGDMGRFAIALMGGELLNSRSYDYMKAPTELPEGPIQLGAGWALGTERWLSDRRARPDAIWSGGNILGSTSIVYILPENGVAISLLTNLQDKGTELLRLAYDIADIVERRE